MRMFHPTHPGKILKQALESVPISVTAFASHIGVSRVMLSRVINERAGFTPAMSIKVSEAFGQGQADIWFKMQTTHDFWKAARAKRKKIRPLKMAAWALMAGGMADGGSGWQQDGSGLAGQGT